MINPDFSDLLRAFNAAEVRYLVVGVSGLEFREAWPRRVGSNYGDCPIQVISKTDLIRNKRAAGRPQDLIDLRALGDEGG